ncbi:MAG: methyltransferase domain-containing protein [Nitrososphaeria archaeon]|nr:methyltransferase domain-containing protein [Nitrosopumilaceae archaeon]NDB91189.1 methyltransferase domain-containing protein [Nitrososphaeria archaeon]NDF29064.1 methyltransferase domain-containing protein [Nitrososphaeria archaeon]NDF34427.1 methyltransferase domain-containing protein [Nitrosopumilaceae archaeon]
MWKYVDVGEGEKIFHKIDECIFSKKTKYQLLEIMKTRDFGNVLFLDGDPQSSEAEEHVFNESLVHPSMIGHSKPKKIFIGGGGTGLTLREVLRHKTVDQVDIVDIDKEVVDICKNLYNYTAESFSDPRTSLYHDDARRFLTQADGGYDCVFLDTTMPHHDDIAAPLYRKEFFDLAKGKMTSDGIFATAANSADYRYSTRFASIVKTLGSVFKFVVPYVAYTPLFGQEWAFAMASDNKIPMLNPTQVDKKLGQRECKNLSFYDGLTHQRIFSIDKKTRKTLDTEGVILSDSIDSQDEIFIPDVSSHLETYMNIVDLSERSVLKVTNQYHRTF